MNFQAQIGNDTISFELYEKDDKVKLKLYDKTENLDVVRISQNSYSVLANGRSYYLTITEHPEGYYVSVGKSSLLIRIKDESDILLEKYGLSNQDSVEVGDIKAPIPGLISHLFVDEGQAVNKGEKLLILEAMKMENELDSPLSGIVDSILIKEGEKVEKEMLLIKIKDEHNGN